MTTKTKTETVERGFVKTEKKGARFKANFGLASPKEMQELIDARIKKIDDGIEQLNQLSLSIEQQGGPPGQFQASCTIVKRQVTEIVKSDRSNKEKRSELGIIKKSVDKAIVEATDATPEIVRKAQQKKTEEQQQTALKSIEQLKLEFKTAFEKIDEGLKTFPDALGRYSENVAFVKSEYETCLKSLAKNADPVVVEGELKNQYGACKTLFFNQMVPSLNKWRKSQAQIDDAELYLKKSNELLVKLDGQDKTGVLEQQRKKKEQIEKEFKVAKTTRDDTDLFVCVQKASQVYELLKRFELEASLKDKNKSERDTDLDRLAQSLKDKEDLESQATMRAAIAARFGIEFPDSGNFNNPLGSGIKRLGKLYDVLRIVPASHLLRTDDQALKISYKVRDKSDKEPSSFDPNFKVIELLLPAVDQPIIKKNSAGQDVKLDEQFTTSTLHEIGHAVDDKEGFMAKNGKSAGYGKWIKTSRTEVEGKHVDALLRAVGGDTKHKPDLDKFVSACLGGKVPATPATSGDLCFELLNNWSKLEEIGKILVSLRVGKRFWDAGVGAAKAAAEAIGETRVYFESNDNDWWSFDVSERGTAVSDYQWRAPAEWFAEPYALYFLDKLDEKHLVALYLDELT